VIAERIALVRRLLTDPHAPRRARVALLALLAYLLWPIDLIPDFIPVLGWIDDVVIAALVLRYVARVIGQADGGRYSPPTSAPAAASETPSRSDPSCRNGGRR
jgi:uncharacterized membrane protein YkvA (DUF1232 family)